MATAVDTLIDELYRTTGKAEIVGGRIVHMSPAGDIHGYAAGEIFVSHGSASQRRTDRQACSGSAAIKFPGRRRCPR